MLPGEKRILFDVSIQAHEGGAVRLSFDVPRADRRRQDPHTDTYRGRFARLVPNGIVVEIDEFETSDPALRREMISTISLADAPDGGTDVVGVHENLPAAVGTADNETGWRMALA